MIKIALPVLLVMTVVVAGMFAFAPVQQATTVHDSILAAISGTNLVRISQDLSDASDLSGFITYDRISGEGAFQIEKLYVCDYEASGRTIFEFQVETSQTTGTNERLLDQKGHDMQSIMTGAEKVQDGECASINWWMPRAAYLSGQSGQTTQILLGGDENNDVLVFFDESSGTGEINGDGATIVAYITGLQSASQMTTEVSGASDPTP